MDSLDLAQFKDLFLDEAQWYIQALNTDLLAMEQDPGDVSRVNDMFRAAHSLKGSAAMMGYTALAELAHATEDVLHKLRDGEWTLISSLVGLLFSALDQMQALLDAIEVDRQAGVDIAGILNALHGYAPGSETSVDLTDATMSSEPVPSRLTTGVDKVVTDEVEPMRVIRVDVRHLDELLDIVTEMVIHRSLMEGLGRRHGLSLLDEALDVHRRNLGQLRDAVLKMRMVPLSQIFDRFPRMVRDLLKAQGKEAQFVVDGAGVEMDRMALEALSEPLVHLLRNAVDHGLEPPAGRAAAGKAAAGTLRLSARQERDAVIIEVSDDGRGIDVREVVGRAIERQIITAEQAGTMAEEEALALICHPGFSLSKEVTSVSGRGVGMSVVKRQVERLRGSLTITTQAGQETTFRLQVPVKLSLMLALLVGVGSETYALPATSVEHIIEFNPRQVERLGDREMLAVDGRILPLQRLAGLLQIPDAAPEPRFALLVRHGENTLGLRVDAIEGCEEVVVKPLPGAFRGVQGLSGVTILGEGQTVLILDENLPSFGGMS